MTSPRATSRYLMTLAALLALAACSGTARPPPGLDAGTDRGDHPSADTAAPEVSDEGVDAHDAPAAPDVVDALQPDAPATLRVLFIGNSYTYVNDLPALVHGLAASSGVAPAIEVASVTAGGATLRNHWEGGQARARLAERWDAVVLQGQSVEPLAGPVDFRDYGLRLAGAARDVGARVVFFTTWARRAGDAVYDQPWSGGNPASMQDGLTMAYAQLALDAGGEAAPVGEAWRRSLAMRPTLVLHADDGSHPTLAGSYLAACVFHDVLTGHPVPEASAVPPGLPADDARFLRGLAATVAGEH